MPAQLFTKSMRRRRRASRKISHRWTQINTDFGELEVLRHCEEAQPTWLICAGKLLSFESRQNSLDYAVRIEGERNVLRLKLNEPALHPVQYVLPILFSPQAPSSLSLSNSSSPSIRSMGGAPSRVASLIAEAVNVPVVMNKPLSARPTIAPRKSRTCSGGYRSLISLALKNNVKTHEAMDARDSFPVDSAVAASPCDFNRKESGFT